jgi:hypothetical protein
MLMMRCLAAAHNNTRGKKKKGGECYSVKKTKHQKTNRQTNKIADNKNCLVFFGLRVCFGRVFGFFMFWFTIAQTGMLLLEQRNLRSKI